MTHKKAGRDYLLVTPCRDEAQYARRTLDSVIHQTERPSLWIIVDDGSTDETPAILAEYADRYDFIRVIGGKPREERRVGPGVIDAFYCGYGAVDPSRFDYVCKFDLDLDIPPKYFEILMDRMEANPRIGTCSGHAFYLHPRSEELLSEGCSDEMSAGMTKFYRQECFEEIGGFVHEVMWDGIDCHRCRMLGWIACSWGESDLRFLHLRPMGSSHRSILTGRARHGFGQYFMGTGLAYMVASCVRNLARPPFLAGSLAMLWGYVRSALTAKDRYDDLEFRRFLRRYQWRCLFRGKTRATQKLDRQQEGVFRQRRGLAET